MEHKHALKILGFPENSKLSGLDFDALRHKSKELYKRYVNKKREADAKKVLSAFELLAKLGKAKKAPAHGKPIEHKPSFDSKQKASGAGDRRLPCLAAAGVESKHLTRADSCASSKHSLAPSKRKSNSSLQSQKLEEAHASVKRKKSEQATALAKHKETETTTPTSSNLRKEVSSLLVCSCGESYKAQRFPRSIQKISGFLCPACRIRSMDPFNKVLDGSRGMLKLVFVQKPIVPEGARREASFSLKFSLPRLQEWRKAGHQVEARMCCLDNVAARHSWPASLKLEVNKKMVEVVDPPKPGHKRRDIPKAISTDLSSGKNVIKVRLTDDYVQRFALAFVRTAPQPVRELCKSLKYMGVEECQQRIVDLLFSSVLEGSSQDVQCEEGANLSSLMCPITMARIETPVRGHKCRHLQCFDLQAYLISNYRMAAFNKRWSCPVCDLILRPPRDLFIDSYFVQVLSAAGADAAMVRFDHKGDWTVSATLGEPAPPSDDEVNVTTTAPEVRAAPETGQGTVSSKDAEIPPLAHIDGGAGEVGRAAGIGPDGDGDEPSPSSPVVSEGSVQAVEGSVGDVESPGPFPLAAERRRQKGEVGSAAVAGGVGGEGSTAVGGGIGEEGSTAVVVGVAKLAKQASSASTFVGTESPPLPWARPVLRRQDTSEIMDHSPNDQHRGSPNSSPAFSSSGEVFDVASVASSDEVPTDDPDGENEAAVTDPYLELIGGQMDDDEEIRILAKLGSPPPEDEELTPGGRGPLNAFAASSLAGRGPLKALAGMSVKVPSPKDSNCRSVTRVAMSALAAKASVLALPAAAKAKVPHPADGSTLPKPSPAAPPPKHNADPTRAAECQALALPRFPAREAEAAAPLRPDGTREEVPVAVKQASKTSPAETIPLMPADAAVKAALPPAGEKVPRKMVLTRRASLSFDKEDEPESDSSDGAFAAEGPGDEQWQ